MTKVGIELLGQLKKLGKNIVQEDEKQARLWNTVIVVGGWLYYRFNMFSYNLKFLKIKTKINFPYAGANKCCKANLQFLQIKMKMRLAYGGKRVEIMFG